MATSYSLKEASNSFWETGIQTAASFESDVDLSTRVPSPHSDHAAKLENIISNTPSGPALQPNREDIVGGWGSTAHAKPRSDSSESSFDTFVTTWSYIPSITRSSTSEPARDRDIPGPVSHKNDSIASEQHQNRVSNYDLSRLEASLRTIIARRADVLAARVQARELRRSLKFQREEMADLGAQLMGKLAVYFAESIHNDTTNESLDIFKQLQEVRDLYQPAEDDYHRFEDQLDQDEYELRKKENTFHSLLWDTGGHVSRSDQGAVDYAEESSQSSGSVIGRFTETHPLITQHLSRIGDYNLLQEQLLELYNEHADIVEARKVKEKYELCLDPDSEQFLSTFAEKDEQLQKELAVVEQDVTRLRIMRRDQGLLDYDEHSSVCSDSDDVNLRTTLPQSKDPLLVSSDLSRLPFYDASCSSEDVAVHPNCDQPKGSPPVSPGPGSLSFFEDSTSLFQEPISTTGFINKWLLHQLRQSPLEITRLRSALEQENSTIDQHQVSMLVLKLWSKDGANSGRGILPPSTSDYSSTSSELGIVERRQGHASV